MPAKGQPPGNSNHLSAEPPLCQRERSTSAPNVSFNLVNLSSVAASNLVAETILQEQLLLQHKAAQMQPFGTETMRMLLETFLPVYLLICALFTPHSNSLSDVAKQPRATTA